MRFAARRAHLRQTMNELGFTRSTHAMTHWSGLRLELSWSVATRPGSEAIRDSSSRMAANAVPSRLIDGVERLLASDARDPNSIAGAVGAPA